MTFGNVEREMNGPRGPLASAAIGLLVTACSVAPSASPSGVAQQRTCGHLAASTCDRVITTVETAVPAARDSHLAIADYALPYGSGDGASEGTADYLIAFAPWGPSASPGPYLSPPMWRVSNVNGQWSITPIYVTDANVCFISLLQDASLTDYAPSFPSGVCE